MPTYSKNKPPTYAKNARGHLEELTTLETEYTRAQLKAEKVVFQKRIASIDALLAECDKAGVV